MSSSKSKKRGSLEVEESVDLDANVPSEHQPVQPDDPIEIEEEEEASQGATQSKSKGKQVARKCTQRAECWNHFEEIKENGKRVAGKCKYCGIIYKADPSKNGTKNLKNHFPKCPKNPNNSYMLDVLFIYLICCMGWVEGCWKVS